MSDQWPSEYMAPIKITMIVLLANKRQMVYAYWFLYTKTIFGKKTPNISKELSHSYDGHDQRNAR